MVEDSANKAIDNERPPAVDGRFRLTVSADKLAVYMDGLQPPSGGGSPVKAKQVHDKLKKLEIKYGVDQKRIDEILKELNEGRIPGVEETGGPDGVPGENKKTYDRLCIVQGDKPQNGQDAVLEWHINEDTAQGYIVLPNELIATYTPPSEAQAGKNVLGKELRAQPGRDETLKPGDGLECKTIASGIEYRAKWYGTIRIEDNVISVDCPLKISPDVMSATMDLAPPSATGQTLESAHIIDSLKQHGITFGVQEDQLAAAVAAVQETGQAISGITVAQGTPVVLGTDARISWRISKSTIEQIDYIARPGEIILTRQAATPGEVGRNIHGETALTTPGKDIAVEAGPYIAVSEDGQNYCAAAVGIISCESDDHGNIRLAVAPGLEVADDVMEAWLSISATAGDGSPLAKTDVIKSLSACGIKYGVDEAAIEAALQGQGGEDKGNSRKISVARGRVPRDGIDSYITYTQKEHVAGMELSNGRIDFHEHNFLWSFKKGDVIGHVIKAKPAEDGITVCGDTIEAVAANDLQLVLSGAHIDSLNRIVADTDGTLIIDGLHLSLAELHVINGDVGQKTGNIHSVNDIHIKGHVEPGFEIESQKSIIIDKNIEGAKVRGGGNITIKGGIRGQRSEVYTPGEISAAFVENADVFVNGDITITGSAINSKISSNSSIAVGSKKSKRSAVIGGRITAHDRVEACEIGSSAYRRTVVSVGFTQELKQQQRDLKQTIETKENELTSLAQLETHCRLHPKPGSDQIIHKVDVTRKAVEDELHDLHAQLDEVMKKIHQYNNACVVIHKHVYPGVVIKINDYVYEVDREMGNGTFTLEDEEVVFRPG